MLPYFRKSIFASVIKDHEMRKSSWVIWVGPKSNGKYPNKRKAEKEKTQRRRHREGEIGVMQPQAKQC